MGTRKNRQAVGFLAPLFAIMITVISAPVALGHHGSNHVGGGPSSNLTPAPFAASIGPFLVNPVRLLTIEADLNMDGDTNDPNERTEVNTPPLALGGKLILTAYKVGGTEPGATIQRCDAQGPNADGPGAMITVTRTAPNAGAIVEVQDHTGATVLKREVKSEGAPFSEVAARVC
jgi:hypothetical protein